MDSYSSFVYKQLITIESPGKICACDFLILRIEFKGIENNYSASKIRRPKKYAYISLKTLDIQSRGVVAKDQGARISNKWFYQSWNVRHNCSMNLENPIYCVKNCFIFSFTYATAKAKCGGILPSLCHYYVCSIACSGYSLHNILSKKFIQTLKISILFVMIDTFNLIGEKSKIDTLFKIAKTEFVTRGFASLIFK